MAQEPSSKELLEAVKQQESGGRRYKADGKTLLEGPQTKYGTAKGEMQVLDMTNKDPGFGVKPAKDDTPDERARVGRDYLDAMVKRYGDTKTALVAYNWGPGNTDKWLDKGGDFNKLPAETRNYVTKITGSLGSTKLAQATPKATPVKAQVQKTAFNPAQNPMFAQLGPSYQAAFAVSLLADEGEKEGKDEDAPSESERMLAATVSKPVELDLGYQSPFPEVQAQAAPVTRKQVSFLRPVRMAAGGLPFAPTASVRPSARAELDAIKAEYDAFAPKVAEYNTALEKYNTDVYKPYQTQVDAYNAALEKYKTENFAPYQAQIDAYNAALNKYKTDVYAPYETQVDAYNTALNKYNTDVYAPYEAAKKKYDAEYASVFATPKPTSYVMSREYQNLVARAPVAPAEFSMAAPVAPKEFSMATPTAPAEFSGLVPTKPAEFAQKAPTGPAVSQEAYNAKMAAAKADAGRRQIALSVAMDPKAYGLSINKFFAEGGQVESGDPQIMEDRAASVEGLDIPVSRSAKELKAYTEAMNPAVKSVTGNLGFDTRGYITPSNPDTLNLNFRLTPAEREITTLHELEHSMDAKGGDIYGRPNFALMGGMDNNYRAYSLMGDDWSPITATVKNMVDNREKLEKFFGRPVDNAYFRKDSYDELKKLGKTKAMFSEQLASLSALEQTTGKFLTQDPEMRELFPNTRMMAVYDALTGPRQTRMDARDLPPHTPVPSYTYQQNPALRFIQKNLTGENEYGTSYRPFPIKRAKGSPETGEVGYFQDPFGVPDSGPVTSDTLSKGKEFKAAEALQALKEVGAGAARNLKNILQGVTETPYNVVGGAADIGNLALMPFGLDSKEPTGGSAQLKRLATEAGIRPAPPTDPRDAGFYMMGEFGSSVVNPASAVRSGVKAVTKGKKAAQMLAEDFQAYNQALGPADVSYAVRNKGTPFVMTKRPDTSVDGFIDEMSKAEKAAFREKYPDVNFFDDRAMQGTEEYKNFIRPIDDPEQLVRYEMRPVPGTAAMENLRNDPIVGEWFNKTIPRYLRKDFATPEDQLVKAADQGKLLHFESKKGETEEGDRRYVEAVRGSEGFSTQGEAKTPYGKRIEDIIDQSVYPLQIQDIALDYQIPPSLVKFLKTNPEARASEIAPAADKLLKLSELRKDMLRIRQIGPEYSAYGQPAQAIPRDFTLPDDLLPRFNLAEVSNRVARFTRWEDETRARMATSALREDPRLTRNSLQDGKYISVALPDPVKNPEYKSLITDVGCDGGWCTSQEVNALSYGSGKSQLHVLVTGTEKNARPVAQVSVEQIGKDSAGRPEYSITDIKEKDNKEDFLTNRALPAIQEQVKLLENQYGGFKGIHALDKLGMVEIPKSTPKWLADSVPLGQALDLKSFFKDVREEAVRLNNGSQYVVGEKKDATSLVQQAYENIFGPLGGFAKGGMVERQTSTARYI